MPEVVIVLVAFKNESVTHIVARTRSRVFVGTILCLQFGVEFLVYDGDFYFVFHIYPTGFNALQGFPTATTFMNIFRSCQRSGCIGVRIETFFLFLSCC